MSIKIIHALLRFFLSAAIGLSHGEGTKMTVKSIRIMHIRIVFERSDSSKGLFRALDFTRLGSD
jgi:hypothetical protein